MKTKQKKLIWDWQYVSLHNNGGFIRGKNNTAPSIFAMFRGNISRNYTSCGKWWWSWSREYRRFNIWPFSIWY